MLRESRRICDQCGGEIPPGAFFRTLYCRPEVAVAYLGSTPAGRRTDSWNGTIALDICQACAGKRAPRAAALTPPPA